MKSCSLFRERQNSKKGFRYFSCNCKNVTWYQDALPTKTHCHRQYTNRPWSLWRRPQISGRTRAWYLSGSLFINSATYNHTVAFGSRYNVTTTGLVGSLALPLACSQAGEDSLFACDSTSILPSVESLSCSFNCLNTFIRQSIITARPFHLLIDIDATFKMCVNFCDESSGLFWGANIFQNGILPMSKTSMIQKYVPKMMLYASCIFCRMLPDPKSNIIGSGSHGHVH